MAARGVDMLVARCIDVDNVSGDGKAQDLELQIEWPIDDVANVKSTLFRKERIG